MKALPVTRGVEGPSEVHSSVLLLLLLLLLLVVASWWLWWLCRRSCAGLVGEERR